MVSVEVMSVVVDMFWENESDESAKERVVVVGGGRGWRWGWFNGVVSMVVLVLVYIEANFVLFVDYFI